MDTSILKGFEAVDDKHTMDSIVGLQRAKMDSKSLTPKTYLLLKPKVYIFVFCAQNRNNNRGSCNNRPQRRRRQLSSENLCLSKLPVE